MVVNHHYVLDIECIVDDLLHQILGDLKNVRIHQFIAVVDTINIDTYRINHLMHRTHQLTNHLMEK